MKTFNQEHRDDNSIKKINYKYRGANSKTKQLTRNIKMSTQKQNNEIGTLRQQLQNKTINQEHRDPTPKQNIQLRI